MKNKYIFSEILEKQKYLVQHSSYLITAFRALRSSNAKTTVDAHVDRTLETMIRDLFAEQSITQLLRPAATTSRSLETVP